LSVAEDPLTGLPLDILDGIVPVSGQSGVAENAVLKLHRLGIDGWFDDETITVLHLGHPRVLGDPDKHPFSIDVDECVHDFS